MLHTSTLRPATRAYSVSAACWADSNASTSLLRDFMRRTLARSPPKTYAIEGWVSRDTERAAMIQAGGILTLRVV